eukprot:1189725-Prorocentrum_minimum.AAC.2
MPKEVVKAEILVAESLRYDADTWQSLSDHDREMMLNASMLLEQYADLHVMELLQHWAPPEVDDRFQNPPGVEATYSSKFKPRDVRERLDSSKRGVVLAKFNAVNQLLQQKIDNLEGEVAGLRGEMLDPVKVLQRIEKEDELMKNRDALVSFLSKTQ